MRNDEYCGNCGYSRGEHHLADDSCPTDVVGNFRPTGRYQEGYAAVDNVNHPKHYKSHPSGVECITITECYGFNIGNAIKYLWRADEKGAPIEDLKKAVWYIQREIQRREK